MRARKLNVHGWSVYGENAWYGGGQAYSAFTVSAFISDMVLVQNPQTKEEVRAGLQQMEIII